MSGAALSELNRRFGIAGHVEFRAIANDFIVADIDNAHATARIALQGAHIMTYQPHGQAPVLWLSPLAKFEAGKSIRGGVPVCWPWFGPHASEKTFPGHGFARTVPWQVIGAEELAGGATQLTFEIIASDQTRAQWPHLGGVQLIATVGKELRVELVTRNGGDTAFALGEALHTYFHISDVANMTITGLEGCAYIDKVDDSQLKTQHEPIAIQAEVDRIYVYTKADCLINDSGLKRRIRIHKQGSDSTVVWNPWTDKAHRMGDFGDNGYRNMVCVESANAADNIVTVPPHERHRLLCVYSVEALG